MAKRIELSIGSKFGDWTVVEPAGISIHKRFQYKCRCICGSIKLIDATQLKGGVRTRCHLCFQEAKRKHYQEKEIGKIYHGWKVIEYIGIAKNKSGTSAMYRIQHHCGYDKIPKIFQHIKVKETACWDCKLKKNK